VWWQVLALLLLKNKLFLHSRSDWQVSFFFGVPTTTAIIILHHINVVHVAYCCCGMVDLLASRVLRNTLTLYLLLMLFCGFSDRRLIENLYAQFGFNEST
jgi:hypothetical protein